MDRYPTVKNSPIAAEGCSASSGQSGSSSGSRGVNQPVKNWPKDNATSKSELDGILKRLAERVQYITGATGAAIGLLEGTEMVCRATSGTTAPDLGVELERWKGLSGECIQSGESLRCDNAEIDHRVEVESCRRMGVQSIVVTPVRRNNVIVGIFELFSSQPYAFQERDVATLQRTAELVRKELETRPLVVDAAYVRLPERAQSVGLQSAASSAGVIENPQAASSDIPTLQFEDATDTTENLSASVSLTPCRNCGAAMPADRLLCSACGSLQTDPDSLTIVLPEEVETPKFLQPGEEEPQPEPRYRIRLPRYSLGAILAMLALFVAFVPIRTNQPANAQAASSAPAAQQPLPQLPTVSGSVPPTTTQTPAVNPSTQTTVSSYPGSSTTIASSTPQAAPALQSPVPTGEPSSQQVAPTVPVTGYSQQPSAQLPATTRPQVASARVNQAGWQTTTTPVTETQNPEVVPQTIPIGPVNGTPHINPEAQAPPPSAQPQYDAGQSTPPASKQPWIIARLSNAIDSFQQMFQSPPDPGPTAEQLGDPNIVVWVDLTTGLYYCPGASSYGKTDKGKFLTQKEAHAEYFNSAIRIGCK